MWKDKATLQEIYTMIFENTTKVMEYFIITLIDFSKSHRVSGYNFYKFVKKFQKILGV